MEKSEIETIYRKYFHDVFLYIRALSENESLAEEITQDTSPAVLDQIVQDETVRNLKRYAELIPEPYREVFHLRIYGELSFDQIGKCYQKSAGWARVTCHRARQMIRAQISQEEK